MPIQITEKRITEIPCDVIVCPTDGSFSGRFGVDREIHAAAGKELDAECERLGSLLPGEVCLTGGYGTGRKGIIHTVGPVFGGGLPREKELLESCYVNALSLAQSEGARSVGFPLITSLRGGFPKDEVMSAAMEAISGFLIASDAEMDVFVCVNKKSDYSVRDENALNDLLGVDEKKADPKPRMKAPILPDARDLVGGIMKNALKESAKIKESAEPSVFSEMRSAVFGAAPFAPLAARTMPAEEDAAEASDAPESLEEWLKNHDDSFAVTLLKLIDRKNMTDVQCYKKANVSRKTFYKINNDPDYRPSKTTVIAFAIALELTLEETKQLLRTVGFTLSGSNKFDLIIEFFIRNGNYNVYEINSALYKYDQECLGC